MLKIRGHLIDVNFEEELEDHLDKFHRMRVRGHKLQACSPFRHETNPSFAVNLENGTWVDSGSSDEFNRKGNFLSLLAYLRQEDQETTGEYLLEKYLHILDDVEGLELKVDLKGDFLDSSLPGHDTRFELIHKVTKYLSSRGISEEVQTRFRTGEGLKGDCVAIPWHDKEGRIINVKYRSLTGKEFWFAKDGQPIKLNVYGLHLIREAREKVVWMVESEIDCLYLWSLGIPAIAFGGASINDVQKKLILQSEIESIIIATDNDLVGHRFAETLKDEFMGIYSIQRLEFPPGKKDVNELSPQELKNCTIKDFQKISLTFQL